MRHGDRSLPFWGCRRTSGIAQPGEGDVGESGDGSFGGKVSRGAKSVQAVPSQLLGGDIVAEVTSLCGLGDEVRDEACQVLLSVAEMLAPMQG